MFRLAAFVALQIALLSVALEPTRAAEYGTADEAKTMLEEQSPRERKRACRDLYGCANASDGIVTAHPWAKGQTAEGNFWQKGLSARSRDNAESDRRDGAGGYLLVAAAGTETPLEKTAFYTKAGDQICGVGYYK